MAQGARIAGFKGREVTAMADDGAAAQSRSLLDSVRPYLEMESLAAFFLGISSGSTVMVSLVMLTSIGLGFSGYAPDLNTIASCIGAAKTPQPCFFAVLMVSDICSARMQGRAASCTEIKSMSSSISASA